MPAIRFVPYGFVVLLIAIFACDDPTAKRAVDGGRETDSGNMTIKRSAQGLVIDAENGKAIAGASLTTNAASSAESDAQGAFELTLTDTDRHATVTRDSFAPTERALPETFGSLTVYLKAVDERAVFRGDEGTTLTLSSGVKLEVPPNAVIDAEGKQVEGEVSLELAVVDGKQPRQAGALPGDLLAETKAGKAGRLSIETGLSIRIFDAEKKPLNVDKNADVVIEVPANKDVDAMTEVYSYADREQRWKEEGSAKVSKNVDGKTVYRADIEHLSWWSLGRFFDALSCVRGCVKDGDGRAIEGAQIWVVGASTPGVSTFFVDADGCGASDVIAEASVVLVAQSGALVSASRTLETGAQGPSVEQDPSACVDAGVLSIGESSSSSCSLCGVEPIAPMMDAGVDPMLDASLPPGDAGLDASSTLADAATDASLPSEAGGSLDAGAGSSSVIQQAFLKASNPDTNDFFGETLAISGNTLVVGAPNERSNATGIDGDQTNNGASNAGAAYVFVRNGNAWTQQAYLKASNSQASDSFGRSVSIDGDTIVVGAPGEDSTGTGVGAVSDEGAPGAGAAYVFVRSGTTWTQQAYLKATNTQAADAFGTAVAIASNTVVVGAPGEDGDNSTQDNNSAGDSGAAYVFFRSGETWVPTRYLKASNLEETDAFGSAVAIDGSTILISALGEDSGLSFMTPVPNPNDNSQTDSGAVYVFVENGTTWSEQAYIKSINPDADDEFGESIAISGNTIVIGASGEDSADTQINGDGTGDNSAQSNGAAYVYERTGTNWFFDTYLKARNGRANHDFGDNVSIDGPFIVVGAFQDDSLANRVDGNATNEPSSLSVGAAFIYQRTPVGWVEKAYLKARNSAAGDWFGKSVGVSGLTTVVGAYRQGNTTGAAYVFYDQST